LVHRIFDSFPRRVGRPTGAGRPTLAVALTAIAARLAVLPNATADGGDAASRVWIAWDWLADPHVITHGVWGPLHTYLIGLALAVVPDPVWSPVVLSVSLSTAACVAMYRFAALELADQRAALLVALTYAVYPIALRNGVSVRSETPFALFLLLSMIAVARARGEGGSWRDAAAGGVALTFAGMLRYEGWLLIPLISLLLLGKRSLLLIFVGCAAIHPLLWMVGNTVQTGDPLYSMNWASRWELDAMGRTGRGLGALAASALQYPVTIAPGLTWPLALRVAGGPWRAVRIRHPVRVWILPAAVLIAAWMLAITRGALVPKLNYTESAGVLLIPFSGLVYLRLGVGRWPGGRLAALSAALLGAVALFSCKDCLRRFGLARLAGISPVPQVENQPVALQLRPLLADAMGRGHDAIVLDHFGWGATPYVALQTRLPRSRIFLAPGAPNRRLDADSLSRFLRRHPRGVLVTLSNSRFSDAIGAGPSDAVIAGDTLRLAPVRTVPWPAKTETRRLTVSRYSLQRPLAVERHDAGESRLAALELPGEAPEREPAVLQLGRVDLPAQVLDVHAVPGEQRVMGELIGAVRK
jgi:hypothetical protein